MRVNPADADEYVIYADAGDTDGQRWLGQCTGGCWTGWEYGANVTAWPEYQLTLPDR